VKRVGRNRLHRPSERCCLPPRPFFDNPQGLKSSPDSRLRTHLDVNRLLASVRCTHTHVDLRFAERFWPLVVGKVQVGWLLGVSVELGSKST